MGRWPVRRLIVAVAMLAALGGLAGAVGAAGWRAWWVVLLAGVVAAVAAAVSAPVQALVQRAGERRARAVEGSVTVSGRWGRVREFADPVLLGVHPAQQLDEPLDREGAGERTPVYVPRDVDEQVRERLEQGGFVLLVGHSTAGKSRTAFEAMAATLPDHVLFAPDPAQPDAVAAALTEAQSVRRCVVWLDDLERFLTGSALTAASLASLLAGAGTHRVVLATLRQAEYDRLTAQAANESDRLMAQGARAVLEQAHQVQLDRQFSPSELAGAQTSSWDPRIADALEHTDRYGLAEYLSAGPELWTAYQAARTRGCQEICVTDSRKIR